MDDGLRAGLPYQHQERQREREREVRYMDRGHVTLMKKIPSQEEGRKKKEEDKRNQHT